MRKVGSGYPRVGIFDHAGSSLGGGQLVAACLAATLSRSCSVDLIRDWKEYSLDRLETAFSLDLGRVTPRHFEDHSTSFGIPGEESFYQQIQRSRVLTEPYDLFAYCGHHAPPFCLAKHGLLYCHFPIEPSPDIGMKTSKRWLSRGRLDRLIRTRFYQLLWRMRMNTYDVVLANSFFTAQWVERQWGITAEVLYPPVGITVPQAEKQNLIVSVGRFSGSVTGGKHQLAQVRAFREFLSAGSGNWRMCLVGSCYSLGDEGYLNAVQQAAEGLPVSFLVNVDRIKLCRILAESKIFWHTQGLSNEEVETPDKAEHFGIATVEAMRAGCVPIVIASGGQREIVQSGVNGFLCRDLRELVENTVVVADDDHLFQTLRQRAVVRSMAFAGDLFERRATQIISKSLRLEWN
jgi:L-malate glycosyltransferase